MLRCNARTLTSRQSKRLFRTKTRTFDLALPCFIRSISVVLHTKLQSHDLNAFWCARLWSRDAKSMLNVATFLKMGVQDISDSNQARITVEGVYIYPSCCSAHSIECGYRLFIVNAVNLVLRCMVLLAVLEISTTSFAMRTLISAVVLDYLW